MRAWLYDLLWTDPALQAYLGLTPEALQARVMPRRSQDDSVIPSPYLVYGLGNATHEPLSDSTSVYQANAERQFFQVWVYDAGGDYSVIDDIVPLVVNRLRGRKSVNDQVLTIQYLETSQEFHNETLNQNFRYIRFQAIKAKVT
jgi:hypothetical protein